MYMLGELISLWLSGRNIAYRATHFQDLLAGVAAIAFYAIFIVMLSGVLLLGICFSVYNVLLSDGVTPLCAALSIGSCLVAVIAVLVLVAWNKWIRTRHLPRKIIMGNSTHGQLSTVVDAFLKGFNGPRSR